MNSTMLTVPEVAALIQAGRNLLLAGDEGALRRLPAGNWIAGTIPYFMAETGGISSRELVNVIELPQQALECRILTHTAASLPGVFLEAPANGFTVIILPASSPVLLDFALKASTYPGFATRPLVGWVSGMALDEAGRVSPKVVDGRAPRFLEQEAVVLHLTLPPEQLVEIGIVNLFEPGDGALLTFPADGFSATDVLVDGRPTNLARHLEESHCNLQLPLVANMCGAMLNTSIKGIDAEAGRVDFFAPVFKGVEYRIAKPVGDYVQIFLSHMPDIPAASLHFSCNCILNYLYADLEGKRTSRFTGPFTFGEVAYQLLNQTLVYLTIE
ncbi:MAG: hypothetical protein WC326_03190 [Candidatus Delongbacteria bacterium]